MGKSPGRWIKTVLFGKKHSKSNSYKNAAPDKRTAAKAPADDVPGNSPVISNPCPSTDKGTERMEFENGISDPPCGSAVSFPGNQGLESQNSFVSVPVNDAEMSGLDQAATKAQSAFRGYLARRAFRALKGIIRLQALIRGHLVRRQAVATLRCMRAVVKFQALARGRRFRLLHTNHGLQIKYNMGEFQVDTGGNSNLGSEKLATNAYVRKLLLSLPTAMPLSLQYDVAEPNSAWNWLQRWSLSHFWELLPRPRKVVNIKPLKKQGSSQIVENGVVRSKRSNKKASNGENGALASFELDKSKQNPRKVTSHQKELVQELSQNELERVKRNLRKVSASATVASEKSETETEKGQIVISAENHAEADDVIDKRAPSETMTLTDYDLVDKPHDDNPFIDGHSLETVGKVDKNTTPLLHEESSSKENQKMRKRRSLPSKQEYSENISLNTPSLPSYMAATQSAKAKLKAQGSSKVSEDTAEPVYVRRHSLPSSTNGKLSLLFPRIQNPIQANGKGSSRTNRSITSSRDDKALQQGWRR